MLCALATINHGVSPVIPQNAEMLQNLVDRVSDDNFDTFRVETLADGQDDLLPSATYIASWLVVGLVTFEVEINLNG
jgi:hypothetical protein